MEKENLDDWLNEWRRWTLEGELGPEEPHCSSIESLWHSPQLFDPQELQPPAMREWMGFTVERIVMSMSDPFKTALRVDTLTLRQPNETAETCYERKRRLAQLPAWQYHLIVADAQKTLAFNLKIGNNLPAELRLQHGQHE